MVELVTESFNTEYNKIKIQTLIVMETESSPNCIWTKIKNSFVLKPKVLFQQGIIKNSKR